MQGICPLMKNTNIKGVHQFKLFPCSMELSMKCILVRNITNMPTASKY